LINVFELGGSRLSAKKRLSRKKLGLNGGTQLDGAVGKEKEGSAGEERGKQKFITSGEGW